MIKPLIQKFHGDYYNPFEACRLSSLVNVIFSSEHGIVKKNKTKKQGLQTYQVRCEWFIAKWEFLDQISV